MTVITVVQSARCNYDNNCGSPCCGSDGTRRRCNGMCYNCDGGCSGAGGFTREGLPALGMRMRRYLDNEEAQDENVDSRRQEARADFGRIDTDRDGVLTFDEAIEELKRQRHPRATFDRMDANGDDVIELGEFL